jgi:hypothetical protein
MAEVLLVLMLVASFAGIFYAWSEWLGQLRHGELAVWHRTAVSVALFAVTMQAVLFVALWTPLSRHHLLVRDFIYAALILMFVAIPCTFTWRGPVRWSLLASAVFLPVLCFFAALAELAY